jgi:copper(I)-binding protein
MRLPLLVSALALACTLAGCGDADDHKVSIENPTIRLAAVPGRPAAAYFTLDASANFGALTSVTSPQAKRAELHESMTGGSMASMRPVDRIDLSSGDPVAFAPGGKHVMLFDVDPALAPGKPAQLVFHFTSGDPVTANATVVAAGADYGGH